MTEFKFFCPQCGQHIQCDPSYSGTQINCPICKQPIVVPSPPRASAAASSQQAAVKSRTLQNILVMTGCVAVLAGLAIGGWLLYAKFSFVPEHEIKGQWSSDGSAEYAKFQRHGKHVVSTYDNPGYQHKFEGDYIDDHTIVGIQTRRKRADDTTTLMRLTITQQSDGSATAEWVALDSNSDLRKGQTGVAYLKKADLP